MEFRSAGVEEKTEDIVTEDWETLIGVFTERGSIKVKVRENNKVTPIKIERRAENPNASLEASEAT